MSWQHFLFTGIVKKALHPLDKNGNIPRICLHTRAHKPKYQFILYSRFSIVRCAVFVLNLTSVSLPFPVGISCTISTQSCKQNRTRRVFKLHSACLPTDRTRLDFTTSFRGQTRPLLPERNRQSVIQQGKRRGSRLAVKMSFIEWIIGKIRKFEIAPGSVCSSNR